VKARANLLLILLLLPARKCSDPTTDCDQDRAV
jgi:hypothetical protein